MKGVGTSTTWRTPPCGNGSYQCPVYAVCEAPWLALGGTGPDSSGPFVTALLAAVHTFVGPSVNGWHLQLCNSIL